MQYEHLCDTPPNSDSETQAALVLGQPSSSCPGGIHLAGGKAEKNGLPVYARTVDGIYHFCPECTGQNPNM